MNRKARNTRELAIVVVNYNSHGLLVKNLIPLARHSPETTIIVVDNFTTDVERRTVTELAATNGWVLVAPDTNLGFGAGMNLGVRQGRELGAKFFLLINPDASIDRENLCKLWEAVQLEPMALISPTVLRPDGTVWFGGADLYFQTGRMASTKRRVPGSTERLEPWLSGACLMIHLELWDRVKGFDESYFLYWEDVDLSFRVRRVGGKLLTLPDTHAVHDEGGTQSMKVRPSSTKSKSDTYYYYNIRNRLLFAARNLSDSDLRRWKRTSAEAGWEVLMRGGRRQLLRPAGPLGAAFRGTLDGLRLVAKERN